jgi:hypothetical protein
MAKDPFVECMSKPKRQNSSPYTKRKPITSAR